MPYEDHGRGQNTYITVLTSHFRNSIQRCPLTRFQHVDNTFATSSLLLLVGFVNSRNEMKVYYILLRL